MRVGDREGNGPGVCRRRGRPRLRRMDEESMTGRCYHPCVVMGEPREMVMINPDELEVLRLVDLRGLGQEEAALEMGISRRTLWKDLHQARHKVADALINGKIIEIEGCRDKNSAICQRNDVFDGNIEDDSD
ncbi:MAG TPA: DUF134 domain-containing protein [Methanoregulaceae archaeon]|nr:DUF134 domain-containing protein [Methanolinea sp.]MCC7566775.1 DUF134 domain-containing protein [Methanoregulaceae archaeon]MDD3090536.1 DUF134 domain-containing protein [Methanoregulaceae archaeon]MDD5048140.1 DUF134 domain-containing protein [Methanoregulaceae archaeon]MDD5685039.1 DUF134 domain-containing protein [Methanoregulaceae archaeon]